MSSMSEIRNFVIWKFMCIDKVAHLGQSHIHPSQKFIAEGPRVSTPGIPPFQIIL